MRRDPLSQLLGLAAMLGLKRFFNLDTAAYTDGALDAKTKELLGLATSMVLRCDDCITYHLVRCREEGVTFDGKCEMASQKKSSDQKVVSLAERQ